MDSYFKLLRAEEEIQRLNVEIRRFVTFIHDENHYLRTMEQQSQPAIAFQIHMKRIESSRYDALHMKVLNQISSLKGFTGCMLYGTCIPDVSHPVEAAPVTQQQPLTTDETAIVEEIDREEDLEEEQAGEDRDDAVLGAYYSVLQFSYDNATVHLTSTCQ